MAMISSRTLFFPSSIFMLIVQAYAQPTFLYHFCLNQAGTYTTNSTYEENLKQLLFSIYSNTKIDYGFYNSSSGQNSDQVYGIGLCRGDVKPDDCRGCLKNSSDLLTRLCPNEKGTIGWYDQCMLRYSSSSIFRLMETNLGFFMANPNNISSNLDQFNDDLRALLDNLKSKAVAGDSLRKFTAGNESALDFKRLYALLQCTPDFSDKECDSCLQGTFEGIPQCCSGKRGGRVVRPSCNFRFEDYSFFDAAYLPSTNPTTSEGWNGLSTSQTVIIIVVPSVALVVLIISICIYLRVKRRPTKKEENIDDEIGSVESLQFDFDTIRVATDDFSEANKLGQGGFGAVYKGMLYNGQVITIKRLSTNSGQGDLEFKNEVLLVAKLQHRNLVRLMGFCMERNERLLMYEFVSNTSLDHFLFADIWLQNMQCMDSFQ
ncbi:hypothetical protein ACB094_05G186000 [Castanea mollissima]